METTHEDFTLTDRLMVLETMISTAEQRGDTEEAEELREWRNGLLKAYGLG
jgi:hypothetical protein